MLNLVRDELRWRMFSAVELPDAACHYQATEAGPDPQAGDI
jgi:hypothetical protein